MTAFIGRIVGKMENFDESYICAYLVDNLETITWLDNAYLEFP